MQDMCEKHGPYSVFCRWCDRDSALTDVTTDQLQRLTKEKNELYAALSFALPALEWLVEESDPNIVIDECDEYSFCGSRDCENCGCIILKLRLAQKALRANTERK